MTSPPNGVRLAVDVRRQEWQPIAVALRWSSDPAQAAVAFTVKEFEVLRIGLLVRDVAATMTLEGLSLSFRPNIYQQVPESDREVDAYPWFPGTYQIELEVGDDRWYALFTVEPRHLAATELSELRSDLESVLAGLSLDLTAERGYMHSARRNLPNRRTRVAELHLLREAVGALEPMVRRIENEPRRQLGREYQEVPWQRARRLDGKSFRWLARGDWLKRAEPGSEGIGQRILAPRPHPSYDTHENRVVAHYLNRFWSRSRALLATLEHDLRQVRQELAKASGRGWETALLEARQLEYQRLEQQAVAVTERFRSLAGRPLWQDLSELAGPPAPTLALMKDVRYRTIYQWYRRLERALQGLDDVPADMSVRSKRTAMLYEYWCLFQVIHLLGSLGFRLREGWLTEQLRRLNQDRLVPEIPESTQFILEEAGGRRLRIAYDQPLARTLAEARTHQQDLYVAGQHNRPDIRVDLMAGEQVERSLVLDAKYQSKARLWNLQRPSVIWQLQCYAYNLFRTDRPGVSVATAAIALYPGREEEPAWQEEEDGHIALAQLAPGRPHKELLAALRRFLGDPT